MSLNESDKATPPKQFIHDYSLHYQVLENDSSAKYLGIIVTDDLDWGQHINNVTSRDTKTPGFLRRNLILAPKEPKVAAYKALVRPQLEYAEPIWIPITKQKLIEQRRSRGLLLAGPVDAGVTRVTLEKC